MYGFRRALCRSLVLSLTVLAGVLAFAQSYRGTVRGLVTDATGAAIPGATVTLSNVQTGVNATKQTDSAGLYVFDFVDPGTYRLQVEAPGFGKFLQENIVVQSASDVSVNASLTPGALQQTVTVEATPPAIEFNSTNQELTIDTKMANDTPRLDRNSFKLTLLEPAAINTRGEMQPFNSWAANSVDLGGNTNLKNNLLVDGNPIGIGHKAGYPPNQDDVQESVVSQNSVDAADGHSAGGLISLTTKSGTNEWHGMAFYLGRYPWLSAEADRTRFVQTAQRQHMFGGTFSNPIIKNKLFSFFSIEDWKINSPWSYTATVPTALERQGDFSQTFAPDPNNAGRLIQRPIYDPFVPAVPDASGVLVRPASAIFPGNKIPQSRMDPLSQKFAALFPDPNTATPGDPFHVNNFLKTGSQNTDYYNVSEKVDYNISEKWRVSGYYGRYHSDDSQTNPLNNALYQPAGSLRIANQVLGDAIWSLSPNTVINFHGDWFNLVDAYTSKGIGKSGWSDIWPSNWFAPYLDASTNVPVYYPKFQIGPSAFGGPGFFWDQRPSAEAFSAQVAQTKGSHYIKYGVEFRRGGGPVFVNSTNQFNFYQGMTGDAVSNPHTYTGDAYASFLLGALDPSSFVQGGPAPEPITDFVGLYIGDTWKVTPKLTLNFGVRDEYETAWHDDKHFLSRYLDLTQTNPIIAANPPQMPAQVASIMGPNAQSFNGLWWFTNSTQPGMWHPPLFALQPRFGVAYRLNDKTALRFGYAMYTVPTEYNFTPAPVQGFEDVNFLEPPFFGMSASQNTAPLSSSGTPQVTFSNPYPAQFPLVPIPGKSVGTNLGRGGGDLLWYPQDFRKAYNHRLNIDIQRQLPGGFVAQLTYFVNLGNQLYNRALNNINPAILENYPNSVLSQQVSNPFYQYGSSQLVPGPWFYQQTIPLSSLLVRYPFYGPLYEIGYRGASEQYQDIEFRLQRRFANGFNFLFGYVYIREKAQTNTFNDLTLYNNTLQWQDSNQPHHRIVSAGTYELPIGRGRAFLSSTPRLVDAVIGGWQITGFATYTSGDYPRFGNLNVVSDPCQNVPKGYYFNPDAFQAWTGGYHLRTNPLQYSCIVGPSFFNLDATLQKDFHITERVRMQLKMNAYNALNNLNLGDPDTGSVGNRALFGRALYMGSPSGEFAGQTATYGNQAGRQLELGLRLMF